MTLYEVLMTEDIDESIREVLIKLNTASYDTKFSCSGAPKDHNNVDKKITQGIKEYRTQSSNFRLDCKPPNKNKARCYLVLMVNNRKKGLYVKELREKLYGTNWHVQHTFNTHWKWWPGRKCWYHLAHDLDFKDRITLEYKCKASDKACWRAWNILLERLL